jgi:hypothetical protein
MIENLDEKGIKAVIAERVIKKLDETPSNIETSTKDPEVASANINNDDEQFDGSTFMSSWLKSK